MFLIPFHMVSDVKTYLHKYIFKILGLTLLILKLDSIAGLKPEHFEASLIVTHRTYL